MRPALTNTELALLSLVMEREMHGYEMERLIEERGMRNWTQVGFSSIYFVLRKLEGAGLVVSRLEKAPGRGPARRVYAPSDRGREAYAANLHRALSEPERPYPLFLQGLAGLPSLPPAEAAACLGRYAAGLDARLAEIGAKEGPGVSFHVAAMFSHARCLIEAERDWVLRFRERLESMAKDEEDEDERHPGV
jgi:DNA-binding PadR family transcriptional regulator